MTYDIKVPLELKRTQQWFGSIIGRPIDDDSRMNPISPSGKPMEVEAGDYIAASPTMQPAARIELYNQQYWWRLLNTFHESFPLLTRFFGYYECNNVIAIPYFVKYPPRHWSLSLIGDRLAQWVEEEYFAEDKLLIMNAAKIDAAFNECFIAPQKNPLTSEALKGKNGAGSLLKKTLYLQPSLRLFEMDCDMFQFRVEFLKQEPEYWLENDFPLLQHSVMRYFYLYRTQTNDLSWNEITEGEYQLLHLFKEGCTVHKACSWLEKQQDTLFEAAQKNLHLWFQGWTLRRWLVP